MKRKYISAMCLVCGTALGDYGYFVSVRQTCWCGVAIIVAGAVVLAVGLFFLLD